MRIKLIKRKQLLIYGLSCLLFSLSLFGCGMKSSEEAGQTEEEEIQTLDDGKKGENESGKTGAESVSGRNPEDSGQVTDAMPALLEESKTPCPAGKRTADMEEAIAEAILKYNRNSYGEAEVFGEGHLILDTEESENENKTAGSAVAVTAYVQTMYGGYGFENGNFVKTGGTGVIPAVIRLSEEPDGSFAVMYLQKPKDGGDFIDSIHELFPEKLWEQCISPSEEVRDALKKQEQAYARAYLKTIGREDAAVGDFRDFPYTTLTDAGVSVEISNKLLERTKYESNTPAAYAPHAPGNIERLEDGIRYIYETVCDPETKEIIYSKLRYDTGELVARQIFDMETGELKESEP